jgi:hypothetical protein
VESLAQTWGLWANVATVLAAVVAIAAFVWSAKTDTDTARTQALTEAITIVQAYTQLALQYPALAARPPDDLAAMRDPQYVWFAVNALLTADSLFALEGHDPTWRAVVATLIRQHQPFVLDPGFACAQYAPAFLQLVREQTQTEAQRRGVTVCPASGR